MTFFYLLFGSMLAATLVYVLLDIIEDKIKHAPEGAPKRKAQDKILQKHYIPTSEPKQGRRNTEAPPQ